MTVGELKQCLEGLEDRAVVFIGEDMELTEVKAHGPGCSHYTFGEVDLS